MGAARLRLIACFKASSRHSGDRPQTRQLSSVWRQCHSAKSGFPVAAVPSAQLGVPELTLGGPPRPVCFLGPVQQKLPVLPRSGGA